MDLGLAGDAAIVTASSSGLGRASAAALAAEGADVVVNGRDEARLEEAAEALRAEATGEVVAHAGDVTEPGVPEALVERATEAFGRLDHLVTNVGGPPPMTALEPSDEAWTEAFESLVLSVVRLVRAAADPLADGDGGSIVCIASMAAKEPRTANVLSGSVRPGVVALEKVLSQELAPAVRANAVLPGYHGTPRLLEYMDRTVEQDTYEDREAAEAGLTAEVPLGRVGEPWEFGATVAFLCSAPGGYLNGVALPVDGGRGATVY